MKREDGGPAFGVHHPDILPGYQGMTLRDWFAGMALQGLIINPRSVCVDCPISARAYELADAMLKEALP